MSAVVSPLSLPVPVAAWRRPALALLVAIGLVLVLYRDTVSAMVGIWARSDTFAHAFLVPPISLWLIWRDRDRLTALSPRPSWPWLLPMAAAAGAWLAGDLVAVNALAQFAVVAMAVCAVPLVAGWPAARAMLFPLLFLFFCVPAGEFLMPMMMEHTADFTVAALRLSGIPVYREGLNFVIPSGNWSVVEACSGVRYLIASLMVGSLFAYLNYRSLTKRLVFVGVSIVVPIVANWLRAYLIVMLGHLSDNRIATGADHLIYGWVFFGVVIAIMFMIGARWSDPDRPAPAVSATAQAALVQPAGPVVAAVLATLAIGGLPPVAERALQNSVSAAQVWLAWPPAAAPAWNVAKSDDVWRPRFEGAAGQGTAIFTNGGLRVGAYVGYYRMQGYDRKLVSSSNVMVTSDDTGWQSLGTAPVAGRFADEPVLWRRSHLVSRAGSIVAARQHRTVWQLYWVGDRFTSNDIAAKALGAFGLLRGRGDDAAVIVLYTDLAPDDGGDRILADFTQLHLGSFRSALVTTRDRAMPPAFHSLTSTPQSP